jgi:hypothetical protein
MPFSWYNPDVPEEYLVSAEKARRMYEQELGDRAALLMRLGYSQDEVRVRLAGNVAWDFELHQAPAHREAVERITDQVFKNRGFGGGGPPSLER